MTPHGRRPHRLQDLVDRFGGVCGGDLERRVTGFGPLDTASAAQLAFVSEARYRSATERSLASAVLITAADAEALVGQGDRLWVCENPYLLFARIAQYFEAVERPPPLPARHPSAVIDVDAQVDASASVGPHAVIGAGALVGDGATISAGCTVGDDCRIGAQTLLHAGVVIQRGCVVGDRCIVHPGVVIGADGFGFAKDGARWVKIPQTGNVRIGDDVEIGANTTIDRGTLDDTVIGDGVKLDNQIQIGHNVRIGDGTIMAAFVGVAGSAVIGKRCMIGGAARIMGHVTIADDVVVSTQTFVSRSITRRGQYTGYYPMAEHAAFEKNAAVLRRLDRLRDRVRGLEASSSRPTDVERSTETNAGPGDVGSRIGTGAATGVEARDPSDPERFA